MPAGDIFIFDIQAPPDQSKTGLRSKCHVRTLLSNGWMKTSTCISSSRTLIDTVEKLRLYHDIVLAIEALHSKQVYHRDLKMDNLRAAYEPLGRLDRRN
jgi:serine/threonine protein kinase